MIAVGAGDPKGTHWPGDDTNSSFSSCGDGQRNPDLVAPGKSVVSLRAPGSHADEAYPSARVGSTPRFMRGSGSSQSAAVVSGAAALLIQQRPTITPDQVKKLMMTTAEPLPSASVQCQGAGMLELDDMLYTSTPSVAASAQAFPLATGTGSLNAARGSHKLVADGVELNGEMDIFGSPWDAADWAAKSWSGAALVHRLVERGAAGASWSGASWSGASWSAVSWSGASWSGASWSGASWSGASWSGGLVARRVLVRGLLERRVLVRGFLVEQELVERFVGMSLRASIG